MTTFLIVLGTALLATGAAMYIDHARRNDPRWIAGAFVFPFVIPLYYRRHWEELYPAAFLQAAALVLLFSGGLMAFFASSSPDGLFAQASGSRIPDTTEQSGFVGSERATRLISMRGARGFSGRVNGSPFNPDRVELIDGVLRLSEGTGQGFSPVREIAIDLGSQVDPSAAIRRVVMLHTAMPPAITLSWIENGQPRSTVVRQGYWMDLALSPLASDRLAGQIQLTIPDRHESFAVGDITAVTSHLRYIDGEVDRFHDNEDTLAFVSEEFLSEQYSGRAISAVRFDRLYLDVPAGRGEVLASVLLEDGREGRHVVRLQKGLTGWIVMVSESLAATRDAGFESVNQAARAAATGEATERPRPSPVRRVDPASARAAEARTVSFASLSEMTGQGATIEYRDGRQENGVLKGIRRDRLVLETIKRGGQVEYQVAEQDIALVRLSSGEVLKLAASPAGLASSGANAGAAGVPDGSAAAGTTSSPAGPVIVAGMDVATYVNRNVRVVADDGKVTVGVFRGVNSRNRVVVQTLVAGGKVDYTVPSDRVKSIEMIAR